LEEEYPKMSRKVCKEEYKVGYRDVYKDVEGRLESLKVGTCVKTLENGLLVTKIHTRTY